jgi:hypothetical protein
VAMKTLLIVVVLKQKHMFFVQIGALSYAFPHQYVCDKCGLLIHKFDDDELEKIKSSKRIKKFNE